MAFYKEEIPAAEIEKLKDPKYALKFGHNTWPKPFIDPNFPSQKYSWLVNADRTQFILDLGGGGGYSYKWIDYDKSGQNIGVCARRFFRQK